MGFVVFAVLLAAELALGTLLYVLGLRAPSRTARVLGAAFALMAPLATVYLVLAIWGTGD